MRQGIATALCACTAVGAVALATGCGDDTTSNAAGGSGAKKIRVYVLQPDGSDPYPRENVGFEQEAKRHPEIQLKLDAGTARTDAGGLINKINDAVTRGTDVIAVNGGAVGKQLAPALEAAAAKGIKVITFDQDVPAPHRAAYVAWDAEGAGRIAGDYFRKAVPSGGKVGMIIGFKGNPLLDAINNGFLSAIKGSNLKIVSTIDTQVDANKSRSATEDILTAHPDVAGMFVDNDLATVGVRKALEAKRKKVFMMGVIGTPEAFTAVATHGYQSADVATPLRAYGVLTIRRAVQLARGQAVPEITKVPSVLITPDNAARADDILAAAVK
jgi:ribose transport system substrate-binding protein